MKTKRIKYTENMCVLFDKDTKNKIIELATDANISQGEFVRDAVEHYINYLSKQNKQQIVELTDFDKVFNTEFFND